MQECNNDASAATLQPGQNASCQSWRPGLRTTIGGVRPVLGSALPAGHGDIEGAGRGKGLADAVELIRTRVHAQQDTPLFDVLLDAVSAIRGHPGRLEYRGHAA